MGDFNLAVSHQQRNYRSVLVLFTHTCLAHAALEMVSAQYKSLLTYKHASDLITMTTVPTG